MNNDLISREALREDFYELEIHGTMAVKAVLPIIEERIDNLTAVDAVEVVRCKDCKHYGTNTVSKLKTCYVHILTPHPMPEDAFCSYGEPKGERKE